MVDDEDEGAARGVGVERSTGIRDDVRRTEMRDCESLKVDDGDRWEGDDEWGSIFVEGGEGEGVDAGGDEFASHPFFINQQHRVEIIRPSPLVSRNTARKSMWIRELPVWRTRKSWRQC